MNGADASTHAWDSFRHELRRLVAEARDCLRTHLRDGELDLRERGGNGRSAELVLGRSRFLLDCVGVTTPVAELVDAFGATPVVAVLVRRATEARASSWLACDPATGVWRSSHHDVLPAHPSDPAAFERFVWSVFVGE